MVPEEVPLWSVRAMADGLVAETAIADDPITIGTGARADARLDHRDLDAYHVEVVPEGAGILVRDLGSRVGTWLAGPSRLRIVEARVEPPVDLLLGHVHVQIRQAVAPRPGYASASIPLGDEAAAPVRRAPAGEPADEVSKLLVGRSYAIWQLRDRIRKYAKVDKPILVVGETGTGKELVAKSLHAMGRNGRPLVVLNCANLLPTIVDSELFGHEVGAFSGADKPYSGAFRQAAGGTLFLDEIGELPGEVQSKLLRALGTRDARPLGGKDSYVITARVVGATNRDPRRPDSGFRQDLYERFVVDLRTPPLRERPEDVADLVPELLGPIGEELGVPILGAEKLMALAKEQLGKAAFPGNVRGLVMFLTRAVIEGPDAPSFEVAAAAAGAVLPPLESLLELDWKSAEATFARYYWACLRERVGGNNGKMIEISGADRATVYRWLNKTR